jgi:hypothetical protein
MTRKTEIHWNKGRMCYGLNVSSKFMSGQCNSVEKWDLSEGMGHQGSALRSGLKQLSGSGWLATHRACYKCGPPALVCPPLPFCLLPWGDATWRASPKAHTAQWEFLASKRAWNNFPLQITQSAYCYSSRKQTKCVVTKIWTFCPLSMWALPEAPDAPFHFPWAAGLSSLTWSSQLFLFQLPYSLSHSVGCWGLKRKPVTNTPVCPVSDRVSTESGAPSQITPSPSPTRDSEVTHGSLLRDCSQPLLTGLVL